MKDPRQIIKDMEKLDEMEFNPVQQPLLNEKVLRDKRKKLRETFERIVRLYERENPETYKELRKVELDYETKRGQLALYFDSVKNAESVEVDSIPLPDMPHAPSNIHIQDIPLPGAQPPSILKKNAPFGKGALSAGPILSTVPGVPRLPPGKKPPGPPPGPPPPQVLALYGIPSRRTYGTDTEDSAMELGRDRDSDSGSDRDRDDVDEEDSDSEEDSEEEREEERDGDIRMSAPRDGKKKKKRLFGHRGQRTPGESQPHLMANPRLPPPAVGQQGPPHLQGPPMSGPPPMGIPPPPPRAGGPPRPRPAPPSPCSLPLSTPTCSALLPTSCSGKKAPDPTRKVLKQHAAAPSDAHVHAPRGGHADAPPPPGTSNPSINNPPGGNPHHAAATIEKRANITRFVGVGGRCRSHDLSQTSDHQHEAEVTRFVPTALRVRRDKVGGGMTMAGAHEKSGATAASMGYVNPNQMGAVAQSNMKSKDQMYEAFMREMEGLL
ncbi:hypothetical protein F7725_003987 [Dissostichus mawsoni]|uniref:WW domain-binding protein 11 n=1 Tax=Dissostichus mawsoni TaxID=36200 RepID=A0A7J5YDQ9_DISMA|nr:hypothetical protein F7725_003987 [Dissostichus mawsoni]